MKQFSRVNPDRLEVITYFFRMGLGTKQADPFFIIHQQSGWKLANGQPVKNWKSLAFNWVKSFGKAKPVRQKSINCIS